MEIQKLHIYDIHLILDYLPFNEIVKLRKISKYFKYIADQYLKKKKNLS